MTDGWQTYTNPLGFSIRYPAAWSQEGVPQQAGDTYQTVTLQGTDGEVDLHWGVGFGGACPQGYTTVKVAEGELPACYSQERRWDRGLDPDRQTTGDHQLLCRCPHQQRGPGQP